jgi:hypothetical protein
MGTPSRHLQLLSRGIELGHQWDNVRALASHHLPEERCPFRFGLPPATILEAFIRIPPEEFQFGGQPFRALEVCPFSGMHGSRELDVCGRGFFSVTSCGLQSENV